VTMGRFVGHLSDGAIAAALATMDDAAVLRVAFLIEDKSDLSRLFARLPEGRHQGVVTAAAEEGLWLEALDLLNHLHARQRKEMILAAMALDERARQAILDTIIAHDLSDEVQLIAEHDDSIQERLAERRRQTGQGV
jgi:hypothetical protein